MSATTTRSNKEISRQIKARVGDLLAMGTALGLADLGGTPRKITFRCPLHGGCSAGASIKDGGPVWHCFGCDEGGDYFNLVAVATGLVDWPQIQETAARIAGVNLPTRGAAYEGPFPDANRVTIEDLIWLDNFLAAVARMDLVDPTEEAEDAPDTTAKPEAGDVSKVENKMEDEVEDEAVAPAASTPAAAPAREAEYVALWERCMRLDDPQIPNEVLAYLRGRALPPAELLGTTPAQDLVRVLPQDQALPSWAAREGIAWSASKHWVIVRVHDALARLAGLRARSVDPGCPAGEKEMVGGGVKLAGTVLADTPGELVLRLGAQKMGNALKTTKRQLVVLIAEGVPDFLTLAIWAKRWRATPAAADTVLVVFGVYAGGWTQSVADRLPAGTRVIIRNHSDPKGCGYRDEIAETLWARRCVVEVRHPDGIPTKTKIPDENDDLVRFGLDGIDPLAGNTARPAPPKGGFPITELGNAERLAHRHGADLRYCAKWNQWLAWDGSRWDSGNPLEVERRAAAVARDIRTVEAPKIKSEEYREKVETWSYRSESSKVLYATAKLARALREVEVRPDQLDAEPWALTVHNGTIDLRTGRLVPSSRAAMSTKMSTVVYDPHAQCPQWLKFLDEIMGGNQALVAFLRRAVGYSLTGSTREHAFFILHGAKGRNGKGTFVGTVQALLGDYAGTVDRRVLVDRAKDAHPADLASLLGVRFAATSEADETAHLSHDTVKAIVSEDRIAARRMGQDWFEFRPTHKLWYSVNDAPRIKADDTALLARIKLVPFLQSYLGREDRDLPGKLLAELPGILQWAVEGCLEWQRVGLDAPPEVTASVEKLRVANDDIGRFLAEECEVEPGARVSKKALYVAYKQWANENGMPHPLAAKTLGARLDKKGFGETKSNGVEYRLGIRLRNGGTTSPYTDPVQLDAAIEAIEALVGQERHTHAL